MADISKITPPGSQTTYNLKDATAREQAAENKTNISYLIDTGAKNLSPVNSGQNVGSAGNIISSTAKLPAGDYVFYWKNSQTSGLSTVINCYKADDTRVVNENKANESIEIREITIPEDCVRFTLYCTGINQVTDFMICTKTAWATSQSYEPYCPTLADLYELVKSYHSTP